MKIRPISYKGAPEQVVESYRRIAEALNVPHVPLFFQYLGAFPDYLVYITDSIVKNVSHSRFHHYVHEHNNFANEIFAENFEGTFEMKKFVERHGQNPEFYHFKTNEADRLMRINASIMLVFLALREAVKGWAVAAKKLPSDTQVTAETGVSTEVKEELMYGDIVPFYLKTEQHSHAAILQGNGQAVAATEDLVKREGHAITEAFLPRYLALCRDGFSDLLKRQDFLFFRVEAEKVALRSLDNLPEKVFSPINIVLSLAKEYPNFPDLLYMLSEHFPTYSVHRWLLSGFIKRGLV